MGSSNLKEIIYLAKREGLGIVEVGVGYVSCRLTRQARQRARASTFEVRRSTFLGPPHARLPARINLLSPPGRRWKCCLGFASRAALLAGGGLPCVYILIGLYRYVCMCVCTYTQRNALPRSFQGRKTPPFAVPAVPLSADTSVGYILRKGRNISVGTLAVRLAEAGGCSVRRRVLAKVR